MVLHFLLLFTLNQPCVPLSGMGFFPLSWNTVALGKPDIPAPLLHPQFWVIPQEAWPAPFQLSSCVSEFQGTQL